MKNPKYRIMKHCFRDDETGAVKSVYKIEVLKKVWGLRSLIHWGKYLEWRPYRYCFGVDSVGGCMYTSPKFNSLKAAKKYLRNLKQPVYLPEQVT